MSTRLTFKSYTLETTFRNDQVWLSSSELAKALQYSSSKTVTDIYNNNKDEFTTAMSEVVESTTPRNLKVRTRIFSLRGAHLIAMFARTPVAKEFRKWVLDILDKEVNQHKTQVSPVGHLTPEQQTAIKELVKSRAETLPEDRRAKAVISMWSALKSHFGMTYKLINPEKFTEALSLVARIPLSGETPAISHPALPRRWLVSNYSGEVNYTPVPDNAFVMTAEEFFNHAEVDKTLLINLVVKKLSS